MNKAKKMLLAGFLACTMLATGSVLVGCGEGDLSSSDGGSSSVSVPESSVPESSVPESSVPESSVPESSAPESSAPEAWELGSASVTYTVDKNGVETANYTVVSEDGEEYTSSVATGRTVVDVDFYNVKINGELVEAPVIETTVGNEPKIEILALFNDDTTGWVTVTDDMYIGAKPDYTKAGLYTAQIKLIKRLSAAVLVNGDEPVVVETMFLNENMGGMCVLWNKADVVAGTYDVSSVLWGNYTYLNGVESQVVVNATADQIKPIDWTAESPEGVYNFSVTDANGNSGVLQAYVKDEGSETTAMVAQRQLGSFTMMNSLEAVKGSSVEDLNLSDMIVMEGIVIGEYAAMAMRIVEVPETAVYALDTSVCGDQSLTATWTENDAEVTATASVFVYENKEEVVEVTGVYVNSYEAVESGVIDMEIYTSSYTSYTQGTGADKEELMQADYNEQAIALTADMIKGTVDFTTAGVKVFTIEVGGNEYTYAVELWKEAEKPVATTTNIASIDLPEEITFVKDSENIELYVRQNYANNSYMVTYIESVNGYNEDYVTLKASAFDWSDVDMSTVGEYDITVTYEGYVHTIKVNVVAELVEPEQGQMIAMLQANYDFVLMGLNNGLVGIILYDNGTAEIMDGFSPYYYESVWATYTLDAATATLELSIDGKKFAIGTVVDWDMDSVYDMVVAYTFQGEATEATLEMATPYGGTMMVTVSMYDNGYAVVMGDWNPESTGNAYTVVDGVLTIGSANWVVIGTGADTQYLTIMTGNY